MMKKYATEGFTLVELMILVSIISILAIALFPAMGNYFDRAKRSDMISEIKYIRQLALIAQIDKQAPLGSITLSNCSDCPCRAENGLLLSLLEIPDTHGCFISWRNAINRIIVAASISTGSVGPRLYRDPWWAPYLLDENEGEWGACDILRSSYGKTQTTSGWLYSVKLDRSNGDSCN